MPATDNFDLKWRFSFCFIWSLHVFAVERFVEKRPVQIFATYVVLRFDFLATVAQTLREGVQFMAIVYQALEVGVCGPLEHQNCLPRRLYQFLSVVFVLGDEGYIPALVRLAQDAIEGPRGHTESVGLQLSSVYPVPAEPAFH